MCTVAEQLNQADELKKENVLDHLHKFLDADEDNEHETSLEERTKSAIVLLQCLPCARSAVLEQIGEVFHEVAKQYVIEVEKQMLSGQLDFPEVDMPELDNLVRNIEKILTGFIRCNHNAWAPLIARWSVSLIGELCSQYGVLRAFSTLPIEERLQLWMNCEACRLLIEISVTCFSKIIEDTPDVCVDYLLDTAAQSSPFFDWAIAHICCCFLDVLPYGILSHALLAFSLQAKNAETVINCVTRVYNYLLDQHGKVLQTAVLDLFKDSVAASTAETGSEQEHIDKCTLPFLLHVALQVPRLVDQITGKVIDLLDMKTISALSQQASKRDSILQRGLVSRVMEILRNVASDTLKILMFLVNSSCAEAISNDDDAKLHEETKKICGALLEMLLLSVHESVHVVGSGNISTEDDVSVTSHQEETRVESLFLKALQRHLKELCQELLNSSGLRAKIMVRVLSLVSRQGGQIITIEAMTYLLINSKSRKNLSHVVALKSELEVYDHEILVKCMEKFVDKLCGSDSVLPDSKISKALDNCMILMEDDVIQAETKRTKLKESLQQKWSMLSNLVCAENQDVSFLCMRILDLLVLPMHQPLSGVFRACMNLVTAYYKCLRRIMDSQESDNKDWEMVNLCDKLLLYVVKQNSVMQQAVLRMIMETLLEKENIGLISSQKIKDDEEATAIKEPKVQLLDRNNSPDVVSRIPVNRSSVIYAGSLNKNKRRIGQQNDAEFILKSKLLQQCLLNTIDSMSSLRISSNEKMEVDISHGNSFTELQISRLTDSGDKAPYCFLATLMAEMICPDVIATMPWPDEEFLKYTVERDIKIKKQFDSSPFLWEILSLISNEWPAMYHCIVLVQSLLASCLTYWEVDRKTSAAFSPAQLEMTLKVLQLVKKAGWLPEPWCNVGDILHHLTPHEVYQLLSGIWSFCRETNLSPMRFTEKDHLGRPSAAFSQDQLRNLFRLYRRIFLDNMGSLGVFFKRFFEPGRSSNLHKP